METTIAEPAAPVPLDADRIAGDTYALHPRVHALWLWQWMTLAGVLSLPGVGVSLLAQIWLLLPVVLLAALLFVRIGVRYGRRYAATFRCVLLPDGLLLRRGVWWRKETFVPRARIQHTDVNEGPIARRFGIATLKVFTAGSQVSELEIEGLPRESAIALRDKLLGRAGHDAV